MRAWGPLVLLVVTTAGCLWFADDAADPADTDRAWHLSSEIVTQPGFCGDCHYGMEEMWRAEWAQEAGNWTLTVAPRFTEAPLYAVQVGDDPVLDSSGWQSAEWVLGDTHTVPFDVGEAAQHVLVKVYGSGPENMALDLSANRADVVHTALALVAPDGTRYDAEGPEQDLRIVTAPAQAGTWEAQVTFVDGGAPTGSVHVLHETLLGDLVPRLGWGEEATFTFPANATGAPPATTLRVQPYHEHAPFQNTDWDPYDSTAFLVGYAPQPGPWPEPRTWNETAIDALWDGRDEHRFHAFSGSFQGAYLDSTGHNDPGIGGSYPGFAAPDGDPVLPGTERVRLELSWSPAIDEPALRVKMSPANWPYFFHPNATERGPGFAVFEVPIQPLWWEEPDQTLEWYEPGVVRSYYDIAPYLKEDGSVHAAAFDWHLEAFAVRSGAGDPA